MDMTWAFDMWWRFAAAAAVIQAETFDIAIESAAAALA